MWLIQSYKDASVQFKNCDYLVYSSWFTNYRPKNPKMLRLPVTAWEAFVQQEAGLALKPWKSL